MVAATVAGSSCSQTCNANQPVVTEDVLGSLVPLDVPTDLRLPEVRIRLWQRAVHRTPMPKAPVDEHGNTGWTENDVRRSPEAGKRPGV